MSNHHIKHNYYQIILDNKEALVTKEFGDMSKLLTINIDLGNLDNNFVINASSPPNNRIYTRISGSPTTTGFIPVMTVTSGMGITTRINYIAIGVPI